MTAAGLTEQFTDYIFLIKRKLMRKPNVCSRPFISSSCVIIRGYQEFAKGNKKEGVWGTEAPQRGPGTEPRWGSGAKPPAEAGDTC